MRLIDADALLKKKDIITINDGNRASVVGIVYEDDVEEAPTIDAVPVVHGEWIEDAEHYYKGLINKGLSVDEYTPYFMDDIACSACLAKFSVIENETQFFKYCPNCGAKMDGKEKEDADN